MTLEWRNESRQGSVTVEFGKTMFGNFLIPTFVGIKIAAFQETQFEQTNLCIFCVQKGISKQNFQKFPQFQPCLQ